MKTREIVTIEQTKMIVPVSPQNGNKAIDENGTVYRFGNIPRKNGPYIRTYLGDGFDKYVDTYQEPAFWRPE